MHLAFPHLAFWSIHVFFVAPWLVGAQTAPVWEYQTFDFGWDPYTAAITRCGSIHLKWDTRSNAVSTPIGPYYFIAYRAGQAPYRIDVGNGKDYSWEVNLNTGGPYLLSMEDSRGATGGVGIAHTVEAGGSCASSGETAQTLSYDILTPSRSQCDTVSMLVTGGTPPYKLTVAPEQLPPKQVEYASGRFDYVLDVKSGINVMFIVEDSSGRGAVSDMFTVDSSGNSGCLTLASTVVPGAGQTTYPGITSTSTSTSTSVSTSTDTSRSTDSASAIPTSSSSTERGTPKSNKPLIIGATIGVLAALGLLLLLLFMWRRGRRLSRDRQNHNPNVNLPSESHYLPQGHIAPPPMSSLGGLGQMQQSYSWYQNQPAEEGMVGTRGGDASPGGGPHQQYQSFPGQHHPLPYAPAVQHEIRTPQQIDNTSPSNYRNSAALSTENRSSWPSASGTSSATPTDPSSRSSAAPLMTGSSKTNTERYSKYTSNTDASEPGPAEPSKYTVSYVPPARTISPPLPPGAKAPYQPLTFQGGPPDPQASSPVPMERYGTPAMKRMYSPPPQYSE